MKNTLKLIKHITLSVVILGAIISCNQEKKQTAKSGSAKEYILVFAGAGMTDVLAEIADSFEVKYKVKVKTNMASSGTLARQIEQGGSPDVYISASKRWANYIDSLGYTIKGLKSAVAINRLVLIAPLNSTLAVPIIDSSLNITSLLGKNRLSMGDPAHVPAGQYAKQSLDYYGWNISTKHILPAKDVRSALMVVEMEEAPLGIVYATDAMKSTKIKVLNVLPEKSHKPIVCVAEVCKNNKAAKNFYTYLNADDTKPIWEKHGFRK